MHTEPNALNVFEDTAISLPNPLPARILASRILALDSTMVDHATSLVAKAAQVTAITTSEGFRDAEIVYAQITALTKEVDAARLELKRPIIELGKQLDEVAGEALAPLVIQRTRLRTEIDAWVRAENERRRKEADEMQARMRAEQAERQRLADEERERQRQAMPAEDAPMPGETALAPPPEPVATVKAIELKSSVVKRVNRKVLVIDDASLIPRELMDPNEKKIDALLRAGIPVPGCRLDVAPGFADK